MASPRINRHVEVLNSEKNSTTKITISSQQCQPLTVVNRL